MTAKRGALLQTLSLKLCTALLDTGAQDMSNQKTHDSTSTSYQDLSRPESLAATPALQGTSRMLSFPASAERTRASTSSRRFDSRGTNRLRAPRTAWPISAANRAPLVASRPLRRRKTSASSSRSCRHDSSVSSCCTAVLHSNAAEPTLYNSSPTAPAAWTTEKSQRTGNDVANGVPPPLVTTGDPGSCRMP